MAKTKRSVSFGILNTPNKVVLFLLAVACLIVFLFYQNNRLNFLCANNGQVASQDKISTLVNFVDEAASLVETKGESAYADFRTKDSKWWTGNSYIFVYDLNGNTLVLPPQQDQEGVNRLNIQDPNGKYFVKEMADALKTKDIAWVEYVYPKPGEATPSPKLSYVKKVNLGDKTIFVGSGVYYK